MRVDPRTNQIVSSTRVDSLPSAVAVGHGLVWVASQLESTVSGVDPRTGQVVKLARFARGELWPGALAVGPYGVWVVTGGGNEVSVFDPETMTFRNRLRVPRARAIAATGNGGWVGMAGGGALLRVRDGRVVRFPLGMRPDGYRPSLAATGRAWVAEGDEVVELDPVRGDVVNRIRLPRGTEAGPIAIGRDLWAVDAKHGTLLRVGACDPPREASR